MSDNAGFTVESKPLSVLHVLEATLGGTLRYMENIAEATQGLHMVSGFAYGTERADSRLEPFLARISNLGWRCYPVDMTREVHPLHDLKACLRLRQIIAHFAPDIIHCHSSKAGALGRAAVFFQRRRPARVYSPHALAAPLGSIYLEIEKILSKSRIGLSLYLIANAVRSSTFRLRLKVPSVWFIPQLTPGTSNQCRGSPLGSSWA